MLLELLGFCEKCRGDLLKVAGVKRQFASRCASKFGLGPSPQISLAWLETCQSFFLLRVPFKLGREGSKKGQNELMRLAQQKMA